MEGMVVRFFSVFFEAVRILIVTGLFFSVLVDFKEKAFEAKKRGLTSMLKVNQQLVGKKM